LGPVERQDIGAIVSQKLNHVPRNFFGVLSVESVSSVTKAWHDVGLFIENRIHPKGVNGDIIEGSNHIEGSS
jgi:hypothetical protein